MLCQKLEKIGIRQTAHNLFKSYLSHRKQCVIAENSQGELEKSNFAYLKKGVPQGSILAPLLYLIYTNDVANILNNEVVLFADDTSIICSDKNTETCTSNVKESLSTLHNWLTQNNLMVNVEKTQIINFNLRPEKLEIDYNNTTITTKESITFLGVVLDERLDWYSHIDQVAKNMSKYCYALRVLRDTAGLSAALTAYQAYIQSTVRYGVIFWGGVAEAERILRLQKRCLRTIYKQKFTETCRNLFVESNIQTVFNIYILECVKFVSENPDIFDKLKSDHSHNTRFKENLKTETAHYSYIQKNVKHNIIKVWNTLPLSLRDQPPQKVKNKLKLFLKAKAYYSLNEFFSDGLVRTI
nr:unnamed protein product [Callosobruchus analis]